MRRFLFGCVVGIVVGLLAGGALWRGSRLLPYRTTEDLQISGPSGHTEFILRAGAVLLSPKRLKDTPDLGWWCYLPVRFLSMADARKKGVQTAPGFDLTLDTSFLVYSETPQTEERKPDK